MSPLRALAAMALPPVLSLLGACASSPYSLPEVITGEPEPPPVVTPERPAEPEQPAVVEPGGGAHSGLLAQADAARDRGEYDRALAYLERAQRIDPDNAEIYLDMAQTHAAAGQMARARSTAERGLLYCNSSAQCDALRAYLD